MGLINNRLVFLIWGIWISVGSLIGCSQPPSTTTTFEPPLEVATQIIRTKIGAELLVENHLFKLKGKRIALLVNQTSVFPDGTHLLDSLLSLGLDVRKIFGPEHGFRGDHGAGDKVVSGTDSRTGLPIISLYGKNKKPKISDLEDIDIVIFDIQDVGTRFYTYISTMSYMMASCAEAKKIMYILDRPNPNGDYVNGPVLHPDFSSFVGLHRVPIVHGMTVGEYAMMVNGEDWIGTEENCIIQVIKCENYTHAMSWEETGLEWVAPSPNLPTVLSARLYPILCWYEGMPVSVGRGTNSPFQIVGAPWHLGFQNALKKDSIMGYETATRLNMRGLAMEYASFVPKSIKGKSAYPKYEGEKCFGVKFTNDIDGDVLFKAGIDLLLNFYEEAENQNLEKICSPFFDKLTGSANLKRQLGEQLETKEIIDSWASELGGFKATRSKYLLYK